MTSIQNYSNQVRFQGKVQNQQRPQANCQPEVAFNGRVKILGKNNSGLKGLFKKIQELCQKFAAWMEEGAERELPTAEQVAKQRLIAEARHRDMQPNSTPAQIRAHDERTERSMRKIFKRKY